MGRRIDFIKELEGRIRKLLPDILFLNGHGDNNRIAGQDNEILIQVDDNHELLKDAITYALSCKSASVLGQKVAENESTTYIGYTDDFIFSLDRKYISKPLEDPKAKPFMESSNQVVLSLLKGHTAKESSAKSKKLFNDNISLLSTAFLAVIPSYLFRTLTGISDKEALATVFFYAAFYFYVSAWQSEKIKNRIISGSLAGLSTGLTTLIWGAFTTACIIYLYGYGFFSECPTCNPTES